MMDNEILLTPPFSKGGISGDYKEVVEDAYSTIELLVFRCGGGEFGVDPEEVLSIQGVEENPEEIRIIDLKKHLEGKPGISSKDSRILITRVNGEGFGIMVDGVRGVEKFQIEDLSPLPSIINDSISFESFLGVGKMGEEVIILVSLHELLSEEIK